MKKVFSIRKRFWLIFVFIYLVGYLGVITSENVEVDYVYKVCPVFTLYSKDLLDKENAGCNKGIINILYNKDIIVKKHELVHAKQFYRTFSFGWIFSYFNENNAAKFESEAYASQINNVNSIPIYAEMIKSEYAPTISIRIIEMYLRNYFIQTKG